jgi:hypothetical protein
MHELRRRRSSSDLSLAKKAVECGRSMQKYFLLVSWFLVASELPAGAAEQTSSSPPTPATAPVHVTLVPAAGVELKGEGSVVFRAASAVKPVVIPTKLPGSASADLPLGSQWTLLADFPGYFAASSVVTVPRAAPGARVSFQMTLRAAGTLTGKLLVDGREKLPDGLEARFEPTREGPPKKQGDLPAGVATCAVGPSGEWRCRVPAGRLDLALHPRGFVPAYLWNLNLAAGEIKTLEPLKLLRGSSVAGWITRNDGAPAEKCKVHLEPVAAPGRANDPVQEFLRSVASEAACQKRGFFQFIGVQPGSYTVVAEEDGASAKMSPVNVFAGAESRIGVPIVLKRPVDFEVELSPPTDWLGRPWRFEAHRANDYRAGWEEPSYRAVATPEGKVRIPHQSPGRFWLTVYDQLGNAVFSDPHVDFADPGKPFPIAIDLLWLKGRLRLGSEPVMARLFFGGRNGATSIEMSSDKEGKFEGPLPKPGSWRVDIESPELRIKTSATVDVKPKGDTASVVIDLPDTKVYGRVVDPAGKPAPRAEVTLSSAASTLVHEADDKGEFELRAFPKGASEISAARAPAFGEREVSEAYRLETSGESPYGPVVLTLRRNRTLHGRVIAPTGPVVGASVSAWSTLGSDGIATSVRSGLDGGFELKVPVGTETLQAIVSPPGGALKAYELNVAASDAEIVFQVEPVGGEILVDMGKKDPSDGRLLTLWQEDVGIPVGTLVRWTEGHGTRFLQGSQIHLPEMAAGNYTVCLGTSEVVAPTELDAWKRKASCASGYLTSASTLNLSLR